MKKRLGLAVLVASLLAGAAIFGVTGFGSGVNAGSRDEFALVEFQVQKLTCGSCVRNIRKALSEVDGLGDVDVNLSNGRARVEFVPESIDAVSLASTISEAGYPSTVSQILSREEYQSLRKNESRLAARFVGRIGDRLISREKFGETVAEMERRYGVNGGNILKTAWNDILQREILLNAASRNGVVVQDGEVDLEMKRLIAEENLSDEEITQKYGGPEKFRGLIKEQMVVERNIEQNVLKGDRDNLRRRTLLNRWYGNLVNRTPVVIFDPALKSIVAGEGKGCGGSCCG